MKWIYTAAAIFWWMDAIVWVSISASVTRCIIEFVIAVIATFLAAVVWRSSRQSR